MLFRPLALSLLMTAPHYLATAGRADAPCRAPDTTGSPRLASLFTDHMVLQRDQPLPVWGWVEAGAEEERARRGEGCRRPGPWSPSPPITSTGPVSCTTA